MAARERGHTIDSDIAPWPVDAYDIAVGLIAEVNALAARVDALTKERDKLLMHERVALDTIRSQQVKLDAALARLGAVERETLERAAEAAHQHGHAIRALPLNPDAAAALDRAIAKAVQDERQACAYEIAELAEHDAAELRWPDGARQARRISTAILARGAKEDVK